MGKIFKAMEKSQHIAENRQYSRNIDTDKVDNTISLSHDSTILNTDVQHQERQKSIPMNPMLITDLYPYSVESEQFRKLKNNILFPEKGKAPKCIMITSTSPGEGKSFITANLAISLAQSIDEYVLLMDCDLRSPSIHSMFGYSNVQGLSEYLSKAAPLSSLLISTFMDKLTILPAGAIPPNPSELLSSGQMRKLIHEVKLRYSDRYILIDTPPPYLTSETSVISRQVDGIVIVIKQGYTRKRDIFDIVDLYGKEKILGVVYNFAKKKFGQRYGKYGYGTYGSCVNNA